MNKAFLAVALIAITGAISIIYFASNRSENVGAVKEPIVLTNPQKIEWTKPTTDEEWAEDVKAESFHIKSTGVLEEMRTTHAAKLQKIIRNGKKIIECPDCIRYDIRTNLELREEQGEVLEADITTLAENEYQDQLAHYTLDIEKLTQSIERMDNELRLREGGFVIADKEKDGTPAKSEDLEKFTSDKIRNIND